MLGKTSQGKTFLVGGFAVLAVALMFLFSSEVVQSGDPAPSGAAVPNDAVKFEEIPDSPIKRVILSQKASERLGVQVGRVSQEVINRKQVVGGRTIPPITHVPKSSSAGSFGLSGVGSFGMPKSVDSEVPAALPKGADLWVEITLSYGEYERLQKEAPARILPLSTRDAGSPAVFAVPSGIPPYEDMKRSMLQIYYKISSKDHSLPLYTRVRVELPIAGVAEAQLVVPYSAVYYDGQGGAWVYTNPSPLTFERKPIMVKHIVGDWAVLSDGPGIGTSVVTVGAPLLFGAEVVFKK